MIIFLYIFAYFRLLRLLIIFEYFFSLFSLKLFHEKKLVKSVNVLSFNIKALNPIPKYQCNIELYAEKIILNTFVS